MSLVHPDTTRSRQLRKLQWILAAGAVLFVVALLVSPGFPQMRGRWSSALWNLLHVPAFFAITWGGDFRSFKDGPHFELNRKEYP